LADLWADCFGSSGEPLLLKYGGRCPLSSWLITVVTNRLIDFKRREASRRESLRDKSGKSQTNDFEGIGNFPARQPDNALVGLLHQAVMNAFAAESPDMLLMRRLVHMYEVTQREIGRIWNWHEFTPLVRLIQNRTAEGCGRAERPISPGIQKKLGKLAAGRCTDEERRELIRLVEQQPDLIRALVREIQILRESPR